MKAWPVLLMFLLLGSPLWAQFYSYRNANGKLVITDRAVKKNGYKLVDTYIPKRVLEARKDLEDSRRDLPETPANKFVLSYSQIKGLVHPIAKAMNVDPKLVEAVIQIESSRNARALSNKGAMGLMQLIPETAERFGVTNPWDPHQNVKGGVRYLRYLLSYFEGNVDYVLAAYNAGENAVDRARGVPPFKETRNYVRKIRTHYKVEKLPFDQVAKNRSVLVRKRS